MLMCTHKTYVTEEPWNLEGWCTSTPRDGQSSHQVKLQLSGNPPILWLHSAGSTVGLKGFGCRVNTIPLGSHSHSTYVSRAFFIPPFRADHPELSGLDSFLFPSFGGPSRAVVTRCDYDGWLRIYRLSQLSGLECRLAVSDCTIKIGTSNGRTRNHQR